MTAQLIFDFPRLGHYSLDRFVGALGEQALAVRGEPPARLEDLGWRLAALFPTARLEDPWGHDWLYRVPGEEGRAYDVVSPGPDGSLGSADDLGQARDR